MKPLGNDLSYVVLKRDLEVALLENSGIEVDLLTESEKSLLAEYQDEEDNMLEYVRDLLLNPETMEEAQKLIFCLEKELELKHNLSSNIMECVKQYGNSYLTSIEQQTGNNRCVFLPKSRILK